MITTPHPDTAIAFQGKPGAYAHLACRQLRPELTPAPQPSFEAAFEAVRTGAVAEAMIPIENSVIGRIADIHHLLPNSGLFIAAEHFQRINHCLLAPKGASLSTVKTVHSQIPALNQCQQMIRRLQLQQREEADTAGAAAEVAESGDVSRAAIASQLAAEIYDLEILMPHLEDATHNTTRFVVMARAPRIPTRNGEPVITSIVFRVKNQPAALYKALGGCATNGVNMIKLESYVDPSFAQAQFYAEVLGHPDDRSVVLALQELAYFSSMFENLGSYPAAPFRGLGLN